MTCNTIKVLMLAPGELPAVTEIGTSKYYLRKAVNVGYNHQYKARCRRIEDDICVIFNGYLVADVLTPNRQIADDILRGVVYIAGIDNNGVLRSLTGAEMQKYATIYKTPEIYDLEEAQSANLTYLYNVQVRGKASRDININYNGIK